MCACVRASRLHVHVSLRHASLHATGQMVQLYGAETTGPRSSGQMGRDGFVAEMAE